MPGQGGRGVRCGWGALIGGNSEGTTLATLARLSGDQGVHSANTEYCWNAAFFFGARV